MSRYTPDFTSSSKENAYYALTMFPYPSGIGLHCGHASTFTITDVYARYQRMQGQTVFMPFGFDAFGLPTENYALKQGKPAREVTDSNKANFLKQVQALNISFDYDRVLDTSTPEYYKRTQRLFLQLHAAGLVYRDTLRVNRCPDCQTVLANDQVVDGKCERCKAEIEQKQKPQRFIKITDYADRLIEDLDLVDRPEETKTAQKNRIGRSTGCEIDFDTGDKTITVFTTRPDTIYGVTAIVLAPENTTIDHLLDQEHTQIVQEYRNLALAKTAVQRQQDLKDKTGVFSGIYATHPLTHHSVPIRFADYVLPDYGTGAVMMVPAHDQRDREFASKYDIPKKQVIKPTTGKPTSDNANIIEKESGYAIIHHEEKVLTLSPKEGNFFMFPGGTIEKGESNREGTQRELQEETGYQDFKKKDYTFQLTAYYFTGGKKQEHRKNNATFYNTTLKTDKQQPQQLTSVEEGFSIHRKDKKEVAQAKMMDMRQYGLQYTHESYTGPGTLINSDQFDGLDYTEAKQAITTHLESINKGRAQTSYRLRDWSVSRQRYRGSPIPMYYDENNNPRPIPESELPVILPLDLETYKPKGKSPLEDHPTFPHYHQDSNIYTRECDTLDTFMCSSFYFLRFPDTNNPDELIRKELANKLFPIPLYIGGKEHTVGHLLYSRFIHKFLYDQGYVPSPEPFTKLIHQGMVLGADGRKMGKRYGNGIDPIQVVDQYGSDAVRTYMMFMGPVEQDKARNDGALNGVKKFLDRIKKIPDQQRYTTHSDKVESKLHETILGVTHDIENMKLNTAVSKFMVLTNTIYEYQACTNEQLKTFVLLLAPYATQLADQLRADLGETDDVHFHARPIADESKIQSQLINLPIQINGKVRGKIDITPGLSQEEVYALAQQVDNIAKHIGDLTPKKIIRIQDRILNIII